MRKKRNINEKLTDFQALELQLQGKSEKIKEKAIYNRESDSALKRKREKTPYLLALELQLLTYRMVPLFTLTLKGEGKRGKAAREKEGRVLQRYVYIYKEIDRGREREKKYR